MDRPGRVLLGAAFCFWFGSAGADDDVLVQPSLGESETQIINHGTVRLTFGIKSGSDDWREHQLGSGDEQTYDCYRVGGHEGCLFRIFTDNGKSVEYLLKREQRYVLRWDSDRELWNLFRLQDPE